MLFQFTVSVSTMIHGAVELRFKVEHPYPRGNPMFLERVMRVEDFLSASLLKRLMDAAYTQLRDELEKSRDQWEAIPIFRGDI
jgi:hypothetical protein